MTYRELAKRIEAMTEEHKDMDVTIFLYHFGEYLSMVDGPDIVDNDIVENQPVLNLE